MLMEAEKKKKNAHRRLGTVSFAALWSGSYALGWSLPLALVFGIGSIFPGIVEFFSLAMLAVGFVAIPGFLISLAQHFLIPRRIERPIAGWWWVSSLGWLISGVIFYIFTVTPFASLFGVTLSPMLSTGLAFALIFLPPVLLQTLLLRNQVRRVWLWPLAAVVSAAVFILPPLTNMNSNDFLNVLGGFGFGGLLQGWVMGLTLLWLFGMSQMGSSKPSKQEAAQGAQDRLGAYDALTTASEQESPFAEERAIIAALQEDVSQQKARR
jgi:hypothetical protein